MLLKILKISLKIAGIVAILGILPTRLSAQDFGYIEGRIVDTSGEAMLSASVAIEGTTTGTMSDKDGYYFLQVPAGKVITLQATFISHETESLTLTLRPGETRTLNFILTPNTKMMEESVVTGIKQRDNTLRPINIKSINQIPNASGNIEHILTTMGGVASNNELTSMYSVRGGSFDENLIYVNDIEIHRPQLIQSAQQEGLSFVNPSMISSIQFSAGGFDAEFGDKLASVLDIRYKQPTELMGSASVSLLGGSIHLEGASKDNRLTCIAGVRYKTTKFLLGTLETKGDYNPAFLDVQTFLTYDITPKLELSVLANVANNRFNSQPRERTTNFSSIQQSFVFTVFYEGEEADRFDTYTGAVALNYQPKEDLSLKLIASGFHSDEAITYDLLKEYWISLATQGSSGLRDSLVNIGVGSTLEHGRDYLKSEIFSIEHKGMWLIDNGNVKWGLKYQKELISDEIKEWKLLDSAGYSLPYSSETINLFDVYEASNQLNTDRVSGFLQYSRTFETAAGKVFFTLGGRAQYSTLNGELTISPRGNLTYIPANRSNFSWHFSTGLYHQPPFYKELRDRSGTLYTYKKAQRAIHYVAGMDINFNLWNRPFVFSSEIYYKHSTRVIPYQMDDVRIQYLPQYNAKAFSTGIDFRVFGEFVPGDESWFSLSLQKTMEDIEGDYILNTDGTVVTPGYYRRPTDQWLNCAILFQDHLPSNKNYKAHILMNFGSGLPFSGPFTDIPSVIYKLGSYRRVDIGFSRLIVRSTKKVHGVESIWISAEILNLLGAENKVSFDWVRVVESDYGMYYYYAVPNKLTGRALNFKLSANFR
ncbi:MAG: carboxypeptidase-like regulatory domain-containing protein [Bacteroidales bacterium]|nr:carboxypeptidase-like regulatory domain-containing protein [Bacteroidales bacterium]